MESERKADVDAAKKAATRRALGPQVIEDAERLVADWNAQQEGYMPMLFSPTIGAALAARFWFLWVLRPACKKDDSRWRRPITSVQSRQCDVPPFHPAEELEFPSVGFSPAGFS